MLRPLPAFLKKINEKKDMKKIDLKKAVEKRVEKRVNNVEKTVEIVFESDSDEEEIFLESGGFGDDEENPSGCTVVKIARKGGKINVDCDVYIGRRCTMGGWNLQESKWHNPFKVDEKNTIYKVLEDFFFYMKESGRFGGRDLMKDLPELRGKVLGCWCKKRGDEPCHGDVLVKLLNEQIRNERKEFREMERKIEAMILMEKLLAENRKKIKEKRELEETERNLKKESIRIANDKRWARRREVIEKYGEDHEMASLCEYDRPLTPIRDIPISPPLTMCYSPMSDLDCEEEDKVEEVDMTIHTIEECREYDEREHCIMSQETQSLPPEIVEEVEETTEDILAEME